MEERNQLATCFETQRNTLRALARRMLGSADEADDAVQEAWLRLDRLPPTAVPSNVPGWLHTVVTRICLDLLRSRRARREHTAADIAFEAPASVAHESPQEDELLLAESVSQALMVVLDALQPAERVAFVLHDMFAVPFEEIAPMLARTPSAAKKLASRARQKLYAPASISTAALARDAEVVGAFLTAARAGDVRGVMRVLAPDVRRTADDAALPPGAARSLRGRSVVAEGVIALSQRSRRAALVLIDGRVGAIVASEGSLQFALTFTVEDGFIVAYDVVADHDRLLQLRLGLLPRGGAEGAT